MTIGRRRHALALLTRQGGNPALCAQFLNEDGIFDEAQARTLKRALTEQIADSMRVANLTKPEDEHDRLGKPF